jgi:Domain of Unknown Function (DUF928)
MLQKYANSVFVPGLLLSGVALLSIMPLPAQAVSPHDRGLLISSHIIFEPPPDQDRPIHSAGGGSRGGGYCLPNPGLPNPGLPDPGIDSPPTPLLTNQATELTAETHPTFLVRVPQTVAQAAEFSLFDKNGDGIYQTRLSLNDVPGVVSISLPENEPALEVGQDYHWVFALICEPSDRLQDETVGGSIRRIEPITGLEAGASRSEETRSAGIIE